MKKRIVSCIIAGIMAVSCIPGTQANAAVKEEIKVGDVVNVNRTEEEFAINVNEDGNYTLYSNIGIPSSGATLKMSIFDENYNVIKTGSKNLDVKLKAGKYFVKIENPWGLSLNCDFGLIGELDFNDFEKLDTDNNASMFKLKTGGNYSTQIIIDSCENNDIDEDTKISLLDKELKVVESNDDMSDLCKYSKVTITPKTRYSINQGEDFFVKVESKNKDGVSAGVIFTEEYSRSEPIVEVISPEAGGYFLQNEDLTVKAYGNNQAADVNLGYKGVEYGKNKTIDFGEMKKDEKSNTFKTTIKIKKEHNLEAFQNGKEYLSPKVVVTAKNTLPNPLVANSELDAYIAYYSKDVYEFKDKSWYYNSPYDNSFKGYGTTEYNCMAYALGITDESIWPWHPNATGIDYEAVCGFFEKKWGYKDRPGYKYTEFSKEKMAGAQAIYYEGHVAVVTEWDNKNMPTKIVSKWGGLELIESDLEGLIAWGEPLIYMKGRQ